MATPDVSIRIEGFDDFRKALRDVDRGLSRELGKAGKNAAQIVAARAREKVPVLTGRAQANIKAITLLGGGAVRVDLNKVPYYAFLEFGNKPHAGGGVGRGDSVPRPYQKAGRYLWPSLVEKREQVREQYDLLLSEVLRGAGLL